MDQTMRKVKGREEAQTLLVELEFSGMKLTEFCEAMGLNWRSLARYRTILRYAGQAKASTETKAKTSPKSLAKAEIVAVAPIVRKTISTMGLTASPVAKWFAKALRKAKVRTLNREKTMWLPRLPGYSQRFALLNGGNRSTLGQQVVPALAKEAISLFKTLDKDERRALSKEQKDLSERAFRTWQTLKASFRGHREEVDRKRRAINYRSVRGLPMTLVANNTEGYNLNRVRHEFTTLALGNKAPDGRRISHEATRAPGLIDFALKDFGMVGENDAITPLFPASTEVEAAKKAGRRPVKVGAPLVRWFYRKGYATIGGQILRLDSAPNLLLNRLFGNAIDKGAYSPSLFSPLVLGGYVGEVKAWVGNWRNGDAQVDGSGYYHPDHPAMQAFAKGQGWGEKRYAVQVRGIMMTGEDKPVMVKGEMAPSYAAVDGNGDPAVYVDMGQLKGDHKEVALEQFYQLWLGIIRKEDTEATSKASYQVVENFRNDPPVREYFGKRIDDGICRLAERGVNGLIEDAAAESPSIERIHSLLQIASALSGRFIDPMGVRAIWEAVTQTLSRKVYQIMESGKLTGHKVALFMDASLKPGTCVIADKKVGTRLVVWRAPTLLPQGILAVEVVAPSSHHLGWTCPDNGKQIPEHVIYLHPHDAALGMQGDDDGDQVSVRDDAALLNLVDNHKVDSILRSIEPPKTVKKLKIASTTEEGVIWAALDHKGPIGRVAIARSRLMAANTRLSRNLASIMSVMGQEAIDMEKRPTPFLSLAITDTAKDEQPPCYVLNVKWAELSNKAATGQAIFGLVGQDRPEVPRKASGAGFPFDALEEATTIGCNSAGYPFGPKSKGGVDPLWWRSSDKSVTDLAEWNAGLLAARRRQYYDTPIAYMNKQGFDQYRPGLTVENALRAMAAWVKYEAHESLRVGTFTEQPIADILADALGSRSPTVALPLVCDLDEQAITDYFGSHRLAPAIEKYRKEIERLSGEDFIDSLDDREQAFSALMEAVEAWVTPEGDENPADMAMLILRWYIHEEANQALLTRRMAEKGYGERIVVRRPFVNVALRIMAEPGGPFLRGLGMDTKRSCNWANTQGREEVQALVCRAIQAADPAGMVGEWLEADKLHLEATTDTALFHCEACRRNIWRSVLNQTRQMAKPPVISEESVNEFVKPCRIGQDDYSLLFFLATADIMAEADCYGQSIQEGRRLHREGVGPDGQPIRKQIGRRPYDSDSLIVISYKEHVKRKVENKK